MKNVVKLTIIGFGLLIISAWTAIESNDLSKATWLIGTWENLPTGQAGKTPRGSIFETWSKVNEEELTGKSYIVKEKDTIVFETIRLVWELNQLIYIPVVKNQNDGLPVHFTAKTVSDTHLIFENPDHDFPQIISYSRIGSDSLVAEISGVKNGQERKQSFPMKRIE